MKCSVVSASNASEQGGSFLHKGTKTVAIQLATPFFLSVRPELDRGRGGVDLEFGQSSLSFSSFLVSKIEKATKGVIYRPYVLLVVVSPFGFQLYETCLERIGSKPY